MSLGGEMCFIECSRPTANLLVWNIELICVRTKWSVTEGARVAHAQVFRGAVRDSWPGAVSDFRFAVHGVLVLAFS